MADQQNQPNPRLAQLTRDIA